MKSPILTRDEASLKVFRQTPRENHFPTNTASKFPHKAEIKASYTITMAWRDLGLEGDPARSCKSPIRVDRRASFSVFDEGRRFKDHADGSTGDVIDFVGMVLGCSFTESLSWIAGHRSNSSGVIESRAPVRSRSLTSRPRLERKHRGSKHEKIMLCRRRSFSQDALELAEEIGTLRFGRICEAPCWLLGCNRIIEARRLNGMLFPAYGALPERKAHTVKGSSKNWPIGLESDFFRGDETILLVEGSPDYISTIDFMIWSGRPKFQPLAMLGKSSSIAQEALHRLSGRRVRVFPHIDGIEAYERWRGQLESVGCVVDAFRFDELQSERGSPIGDLNDLLLCTEFSSTIWKEILPC